MTAETTAAVVDAIREGLPPSYEWDQRDAALLALAARQAADIDRLEADIAERGVRVPSGRGEVLNQAFCEVRQARVALARILGQLDVPEAVRPASLHASKAARARWGRAVS